MTETIFAFGVLLSSVALICYEKIIFNKEKKRIYTMGYIDGVTKTMEKIQQIKKKGEKIE